MPRFTRLFGERYPDHIDFQPHTAIRAVDPFARTVSTDDGDVLEVELRDGDLPRVVKAAHLIPVLIEKGWMTVVDAEKLAEEANNRILQDSVLDALLAVRGTSKPERPKTDPKSPAPITEKRALWLKQKEHHKVVDALSENIRKAIMYGQPATPETQEVLAEGIRKAVESLASSDLG